MQGKLTVADLIAGIGGIVAFLFSFFGFWEAKGGGDSFSAWDGDVTGFASALPALMGLALVVIIILKIAGVNLPDKVATFDWKQICVVLGAGAAVQYLFWMVTSPVIVDKHAMFWLQALIGGGAMATGTIMALLGAGSQPVGGGGSGSSAHQAPQHQTPPPGGTAFPPQSPGGTPPPPPGGGAPPPPPPGGGTPPPPPPSNG